MSGTVTAVQINTPVVGANSNGYSNGDGDGSNAAESFEGDTILLVTITLLVAGGAGAQTESSPGGYGGNGSLTLENDVVGEGSESGLTLTASATGGAGGVAVGTAYGNPSGGTGGSAASQLSEIIADTGAPTSIAVVATGGSGGLYFNGGGVAGGSAAVSLIDSTIDVIPVQAASADLQIDLTGDGGNGSNGNGVALDVYYGLNGGDGGSSSVDFSGNTVTAPSIDIALSAAGGIGGSVSGPTPPQSGGSLVIGLSVSDGAASISVVDDQVNLTAADSSLDLSLMDAGAAVMVSGNSFQGGDNSAFVLSLASDSYDIDTVTNTFTIDGSGANTLAGFDVFDLEGVVSGDNMFTVGSSSQELELGGGFNTVIVTMNSGDLTITGVTQSNLVLDFEGFGSALTTLAQLQADVSFSSTNTELISLPDGVIITLQGTPIAFNRLNVIVPTTPVMPPPPADNLPASAINTPVIGAAGSTIYGSQDGQSASAVFDRDLLSQANLDPSVTGGSGLAFLEGEDDETVVGVSGNASLTLENDIIGVATAGELAVDATSVGGAGASLSELFINNVNGGNGGSAALLLDGISEAAGNPVSLAVTANGGNAGAGFLGGNGGAGGTAAVTLSNSVFDVSGTAGAANDTLKVSVAANGGAGGVGGSEIEDYGNGGIGGSSSASLTNNVLQAGDVELSVIAAVASAALPGSSTAVEISSLPFASGIPGAIGIASLALTDNQVTINTPDGTLSLVIGSPGSSSLAGSLTLAGNRFQGNGDSTLALTLSSGSYSIDTMAYTIAIFASAPNALTGFDVFDMLGVSSGSNSFIAGSQSETLEIGGGVTTVELGQALTTVLITPQAGDLDLVGATSSNVLLKFQDFGTAVGSLEQLAADTTVSNGTQEIALPDGTLIEIVGQPLALNSSDVSFDIVRPVFPVVALGTGNSTLALFISELDQAAQFTISVDGTQIGGVQTTSADGSQEQQQEFDVLGDFPNGANTVSIDLLNGNGALLSVDSAALDGAPIADAAVTFNISGSYKFNFISVGSLTPVTLSFGPDTLALVLSERAEPAGAQFTVSVDGTQIGGVQTTSADVLSGASQEFDVLGNFAVGPNTVAIDYLNPNNSLLLVDNATLTAPPFPTVWSR